MVYAKNTKKRVASTTNFNKDDGPGGAVPGLGPVLKKQKKSKKLNPTSKVDVKLSTSSAAKATSTSEKRAQRKMPVTSLRRDARTVADLEEESDDEKSGEGEWDVVGSSSEFEEMEEGEAEFEDSDLDEDGDEKVAEMKVDDEGSKSARKETKSASTRESHKAQKSLLLSRKASKTHSSLLSSIKPLWERARQKDLTADQRKKDIEKLMEAVRGEVKVLVMKHDASRIVQTLVKYGRREVKEAVATELRGAYREMVMSRYSKFLVTKLIRLSPTRRTSILLEFRGHVVRLLLHREASSVIADAYELYGNAFERALLLHDFYGKEVALFSAPELVKGAGGGKEVQVDEKVKEKMKKGLKGALEGADGERRKRILGAVEENLELVMNNPEKGAMTHAIFHHVLWEYLSQVNELDDEALQEKLRREIFEACQEQLAEMVHTKDGSRVVREFIVQGTAKDRKQIVKVLKPHVERICKDDEAQNVLFTALDVIDDTKLTGKSLVSEITSRAATLYTSPQGRRALLYLLVPRASRHFTPAQTALLAETDAVRARTSKKDEAVRREEIVKAASPDLIKLLVDRGRVEEMVRDTGGSLVVTEVILYAEGDKTKAIDSLVSLVNEPYPSSSSSPSSSDKQSKPHVIDVPHSSRIFKTLLQGGHFSQATRAVVRAPEPAYSPVQFAKAWVKSVGKENTWAMALGGGTFVVAALVERIHAEGGDEEREVVKRWFGEEFVRRLKDSEVKGKKVLLDALES